MKVQKGEYGYIKAQKNKYILYSIIGIIIIIIVYNLAHVLSNMEKVFTVLSVILVLPLAQFLVRLILLYRYREGDKAKLTGFEEITEKLSYLYSLIVSIGKKTKFFDAIVLSDKEIILLIENLKSKEELKECTNMLKQIIYTKGYEVKITVFKDYEKMYRYLKDIKGTLNKMDTNTQTTLKQIMLNNSI